ncbi:hypothetical protein EGT74_05115 [Chitinophaga lutea]|uniref:Uncharacterized protein n=1 Tax=Chitinophaga lutea TaxID=2488634 RepID=A0A3N4PZU9_9BACT|nr:hypothetical protein [Chitinophaga lutea]RPE12925.1 hypothetical protein EGT74_05115 [Chitinophaga lutea]
MQFSFTRFNFLFKLQLATHLRFYLLGMAALTGILMVFMLFVASNNSAGLHYNSQQVIFFIGLLLASGVYTSTIFRQFSQKAGRIQAIMLPVSAMERLAVAILFTLVLFPVLYTMICLACLWLTNLVDLYALGHVNRVFLLDDGMLRVYLFLFYFMQAMVMLGAIWFRRYTFVKTAVMVCVVILGFQGFNDVVVRKMMANARPARMEEVSKKLGEDVRELRVDGANPFFNILASGYAVRGDRWEQEYYEVKLPSPLYGIMMAVLIFFPFFLWFITLLRLREQQL